MSNSKSIVKQASILAIAGILVRIIGLLYRSPLTAIIGDEGNGYYGSAYNIYAMILLMSSYSIPTAISKLISEKLMIKQYNNAQKILKCAFVYIVIVGGTASLLTFIFAPYILPQAQQNGVFALRILCPTIFLSGLVGVLRGYFQAHSTTIYTSISQIIEQVLNAFVSVFAAWLFIQPFIGENHSTIARQGAGGSALGTGAGVLIALCYLTFMYFKKRNHMIDKSEGEDQHVDSSQTIYRTILSIVTPIIIATFIYNIVSTIDMYIMNFVMDMKGMDHQIISELYGVYSGKVTTLINVPIALASAMSTAAIPTISGNYAIHQYHETRKCIQESINVTMLILIPASIGMAVLSYPIMGTLFPQKETLLLASQVLKIGSLAIVFYGLSTLTNGILQSIGEAKVPLRNAVYALVIHTFILTLSFFIFPNDYVLYIMALCNMLYAIIVSLLNQRSLYRKIKVKLNIKRTILLPLLASIIMGIVVYGVYELLFILTKMVFIPMIISIFIGIIIYFVIILYLYKDHPELLSGIPYMNRILRKFR